VKAVLTYPLFASVVTVALHFGAHLSFGVSSLIAFVGWPLVGTLITADDDLPGGWSNPDGDVPPAWTTARYWGALFAGASVSALAFSLEAGLSSPCFSWLIGSFVVFVLVAALLLFAAFRVRP
jgi:hypothetical protein